MMGKQNAPEELFYRFRLEDHVPADTAQAKPPAACVF
jgi:hypothetical protein